MSEAANPTKDLGEKIPAQTLGERIEALKPFADCINEHLEIGLIQAWDVEGFRNMSQMAKAALGGTNDPYYTAFARAMIELAAYIQESDRISLICDDDTETAWESYKHYRGVRKARPDIKEKTVSLAFGDSKSFVALQAADMTAWVSRREARSRFYGDDFSMRPLFEYLTTSEKVGRMDWRMMFATKQVIKNLSNAGWSLGDGSSEKGGVNS